MNDIVIPKNFGAVPQRFLNTPIENDLAAGIASSFGMIGYKGKVWSIRYRGEETALMRDDGDGPRGSIEVVVLKAAGHLSKIWYEQGYVEGSTEPPDCFSTNGVTPDASSRKKQSNACASCPKNAWGSRVTPAGKQGKACSDSKRVVVVPLGDLNNDVYGGPMLLRVPAASLNDLASYGNKMQQLGYPYQFVGTRIAFNPAEAYPKFVFGAIRALTEEECEAVAALRDDPRVARILAEELGVDGAAPEAPALEQAFEQPPPKPVAAPKAEATPAKVEAPAQKRDYKKQPAAAKANPAPEPVSVKSPIAQQIAAAQAEDPLPEDEGTGLDALDQQLDAIFAGN
jgi:hypothetical protein